MNIAIFGGSFNPVHIGHFEIVKQLHKIKQIDKIVVVPAFQNPLKNDPPIFPEKLRWEMLEATFADLQKVELSDFEINNKEISYTYKTIKYLQKKYPDANFYLVLGEDSFLSLPYWNEVEQIVNAVHFLVFQRPRLCETKAPVMPDFDFSNKVEWLSDKIPDVSSSEIRHSDLNTIQANGWLHSKALEIWAKYKQSKNN